MLGKDPGEHTVTQTKSCWASFIMVKIGRKYLNVENWVRRLWCMYSLEFDVAIKMMSDAQQEIITERTNATMIIRTQKLYIER